MSSSTGIPQLHFFSTTLYTKVHNFGADPAFMRMAFRRVGMALGREKVALVRAQPKYNFTTMCKTVSKTDSGQNHKLKPDLEKVALVRAQPKYN